MITPTEGLGGASSVIAQAVAMSQQRYSADAGTTTTTTGVPPTLMEQADEGDDRQQLARVDVVG